jgi:glycosyltransferase involved in cell wall biosynthesis
MKILFITAFTPNKMTAGQNFTREVINDLSKSNFIDLIYFPYPGHTISDLNKINSIREIPINKKRKLINSILFFFLHPFFSSRFTFSLLFKIRRIAKNYDILYFDYSQIFIYSLFVNHPFKCLFSHDIIVQRYQRKKGLHKLLIPFLKFTEELVLSSGKFVFCPSKKDADLLKVNYKINAFVFDFYINVNLNAFANYDVPSIKNKYIFFGAWNRKDNSEGLLWFLQKVFPFVKSDIYFEIMGSGMPEYILKILNFNNRIKYLGFVEDPIPIILESAALIAPVFQGAGVKVKVLETLATGTPIIGTNVAFEGIEIPEINDCLFLCETGEDFIKIINEFKVLTIPMKKDLQFRFASNYPKNKVGDFINTFVGVK